MGYTWMGNAYAWDFFLVGTGFASGCTRAAVGGPCLGTVGLLASTLPFDLSAWIQFPTGPPVCVHRLPHPLRRDQHGTAPLLEAARGEAQQLVLLAMALLAVSMRQYQRCRAWLLLAQPWLHHCSAAPPPLPGQPPSLLSCERRL